MKTKQAQQEATIDAPRTKGNLTLYPATFGLLEWLQNKRKSPLVCGGKIELKHVMELCFAFTRPSAVLAAMTDARLTEALKAFSHSVTPDIFRSIEVHAERELLKFQKTAVVPKKREAAKTPRKR